MRVIMTIILATTVLTGALHPAHAEEGTCNSAASEKKLAGAAKGSFLKKCQADAQAKCDSSAASKKLAGAAKSSFTKKCVSDAIGA